MHSVKLYRHKETAQIIAACKDANLGYLTISGGLEQTTTTAYYFDDYFHANFEPLPVAPQVIGLLPHQFTCGQLVLVRDFITATWRKAEYAFFEETEALPFKTRKGERLVGYHYCLPFEGNEHLENIITEHPHGAVPENYASPRD